VRHLALPPSPPFVGPRPPDRRLAKERRGERLEDRTRTAKGGGGARTVLALGLGTVARRSEKGGGPMSPGWARAGQTEVEDECCLLFWAS
jgi:hypothetical protein